MVVWENQKNTAGGKVLKSTKIDSIAFGRDRNEVGIKFVNQLIKRMKTRQELKNETGGNFSIQKRNKN